MNNPTPNPLKGNQDDDNLHMFGESPIPPDYAYAVFGAALGSYVDLGVRDELKRKLKVEVEKLDPHGERKKWGRIPWDQCKPTKPQEVASEIEKSLFGKAVDLSPVPISTSDDLYCVFEDPDDRSKTIEICYHTFALQTAKNGPKMLSFTYNGLFVNTPILITLAFARSV